MIQVMIDSCVHSWAIGIHYLTHCWDKYLTNEPKGVFIFPYISAGAVYHSRESMMIGPYPVLVEKCVLENEPITLTNRKQKSLEMNFGY